MKVLRLDFFLEFAQLILQGDKYIYDLSIVDYGVPNMYRGLSPCFTDKFYMLRINVFKDMLKASSNVQ